MTGAAIGVGAGLAAAGTAIAGGAMAVGGTKARKQYFGDTAEQADAYRNQYESGIQGGNATMGQGVGMMGDAARYAQGNTALGVDMYRQGQSMGQAQMDAQNAQIATMLRQTNTQGASVAQEQMRQGLDQSQRAMMAQAASARGGNQAAAMRTAQATGSQMALDVNQQAGVLRAQEQQAFLARKLQAQQMAAQAYGQQSQLGFGMQGQGVGLANQAAGIYGQMGQATGQLGLGSQGQFLDARTSMETAALNSDTQIAMAKAQAQQAKRAGLLNLGGSLIGAGGNVMASGMG